MADLDKTKLINLTSKFDKQANVLVFFFRLYYYIYMEILRSFEQIYQNLDNALEIDKAFDLEKQNFANLMLAQDNLLPVANFIKEKALDAEKIKNLVSLIFQMTDYVPVLCNLTHLFLLAKKYEELYFLINKIFLAHIGQKRYLSTTATTPQQKSFDRLVEIVMTANIAKEPFLEFLLATEAATNRIYSVWQQPALEYLQNFFWENENWLMHFVAQNPEKKYSTYSAILNCNTTKGIDLLFNDYITTTNPNKEAIVVELKNFKRETILYIDTVLPKTNPETELKIVELLLDMTSDNEVMSRIQEIYATTKNSATKELISSSLGICNTINIRTEKQFLYAARRKIKDPQERTLGVPFDHFSLRTKSGVIADNTVFSFIIFLFKEEKNLRNLYKLQILENIFEKEDLQTFASALFERLKSKGDILQAKWCVRMFALLCNSSQINQTFNFLTTLLHQDRTKEAMYLILCLIYSKKIEIIDFIKISLEENQLLIKEHLDELITTISNTLNLHEEDIKDMLVPNQFSVGEFDIQRDRLFSAFIAGKTYPPQIFCKMFLENKIYNKLAQNLVFGEYRGGKLYNAFVLDGDEGHYIVGKTIFEDDQSKDADITLGIIHPLDCDFKFDKAINYFPSPTFNQFEPARFSAENLSISVTTVSRFMGMIIKPQKFLQYAFANGFRPNKDKNESSFLSIVHPFTNLNILAEVEFQKPLTDTSTYGTVAKICFFRLSDTLQAGGRFLTQKASALPLCTLPNRYYNHILSIIFEASKL